MRIVKIAEDSNGFKLIAFQSMYNNKGFKPDYSTTSFADYSNGYLRLFYQGGYTTKAVPDFRAALKYIFSL